MYCKNGKCVAKTETKIYTLFVRKKGGCFVMSNKMTNRKKIQVTISEETYDKLLNLSEKYGVTYNSVAAIALGQWVEQQEKTIDVLSQTVDTILSSPNDVLSNPGLLDMVKEILLIDKDFKNNARDFLDEK